MEYISRWLAEAVDFGNEDKVYDKVAKTVESVTDSFEVEKGSIDFDDISEALVARSILEDNYPTVDINESEEKVKVTFSKTETESLREATWISGMYDEILPDKNPANWVGNKGSISFGEDYPEDEETFYCPGCGIELSYLGGQGDYEEFTCDDCGEYWYLDPFSKDHSLISAEEAWGTWAPDGNDEFEELTEDRGIPGNQMDLTSFDDEYMSKGYHVKPSPETLFKSKMIHTVEEKVSKQLGINKVEGYFESTFHKEPKNNTDTGKYRLHLFAWGYTDKEAFKAAVDDCLVKDFNATNIETYNLYCPRYNTTYDVKFDVVRAMEEAIEKHDELNQDLFDGDELRPEVKEKLFYIVDNFKKNLKDDEVELEIDDIVIVGSNASYNFTDKSDIDLHILADLSVYPNKEELAQKLYNAYRALWNAKFSPTIAGKEVEIYVEPSGSYNEPEVEMVNESLILTEAVSNGVYSLYNGWIKYPKKDTIPDPIDVSSEVDDYTTKADMCQTIEDIDNFIDEIYVLRQTSILQDGEYGKGNLIFKELRNNGILQNLKDKKVELLNKEMSL